MVRAMSARRVAGARTDRTALPLHPLLLAAFPVLFLFAENAADQLVLNPLWLPLAASVAGALIVLLLAVVVTADWIRGGLVASVLIVLFFSFGHVWYAVADVISIRAYLVIAYVLIGFVALLLIWRGGRWITGVARFANVAAIVLVAFNVVRIAEFVTAGADSDGRAERSGSAAASLPDRETERPDVYYIVLDRYANGETLQRRYGFDNEPFLRELEGRGFAVARDSWSSYFRTAPSLLSTLSMEYLDGDVLREQDQHPPTLAPVHRALQQSLPVPATFKQLGYEYIHIGSWWYPTSRNADADRIMSYEQHSEFGVALSMTTALTLLEPAEPVEAGPETLSRPELARRHTLFAFDRLTETASRPGPTFVFAHLLVPHPPYAFRADGGMTTETERQTTPSEQLYIDQLRWTNSRVLELVDQLRGTSDGENAIIILQADEGPYPDRFQRERAEFDWLDEATPDEVLEKHGILNAFHLPGVDADEAGIHDRISPVNTFRIIFNEYFGAGLELLPDVVYLSPDYSRMYDFTEYERP